MLNVQDSAWYYFDNLGAESRVSKLALGNKPTFDELQALALWQLNNAEEWPKLFVQELDANKKFAETKSDIRRRIIQSNPSDEEIQSLAQWYFHDSNKWRDLYFSTSDEVYTFIKNIFNSEIGKVFDQKSKLLQQKLENYTKSNIRNGIKHKRITPTNLTFVLLGLLNFHQNDEINLGYRKNRLDLQQYAVSWFNTNIHKDAPLTYQIMNQLRYTVEPGYRKQKELKQVVLRGLISVL